jgi:potassium channel subfamily K, other eukaryote
MVTVLVFGTEHPIGNGFSYGEAFWITICSTVVSMITNLTLIWDFLRTPNFSAAGMFLSYSMLLLWT